MFHEKVWLDYIALISESGPFFSAPIIIFYTFNISFRWHFLHANLIMFYNCNRAIICSFSTLSYDLTKLRKISQPSSGSSIFSTHASHLRCCWAWRAWWGLSEGRDTHTWVRERSSLPTEKETALATWEQVQSAWAPPMWPHSCATLFSMDNMNRRWHHRASWPSNLMMRSELKRSSALTRPTLRLMHSGRFQQLNDMGPISLQLMKYSIDCCHSSTGCTV